MASSAWREAGDEVVGQVADEMTVSESMTFTPDQSPLACGS